jgi:four helix bundle protein
MGSASELDYHLLLCRDFAFISGEQYDRTMRELVRIRKMRSGLLASIEKQINGRANAAGA